MRLVLIVNSDLRVEKWQLASLMSVDNYENMLSMILVCENPTKRKFKIKNVLYYLLSMFAKLRIAELSRVRIPDSILNGTKVIRFIAQDDGAWQSIPYKVLVEIPKDAVIVRFGMNLLRIDERNLPSAGIISFHHGDSRVYRGRPPAFYEIKNGENCVGVTLQKLSNQLDAGMVLRQAHTICKRYSYIKTLRCLYIAGIPLLADFLRNHDLRVEDNSQNIVPRRYSLPNNSDLFKFLILIVREKLKNLKYGALYEKRWSLGYVDEYPFPPSSASQISTLQIIEIKSRPRQSFADPVGMYQGKLYCEKISKWNNKGTLVAIFNGEVEDLKLPKKNHFSFPSLIENGGDVFLLPEMAQHCSPSLFKLNDLGSIVGKPEPLLGLEDSRLLDPIHYFKDGLHFIFGNAKKRNDFLELFVSENLLGPYVLHRASPILISPIGGRMAGPIVERHGKRYRVGQDSSNSYGDGVVVSEILDMTKDSYVEKQIAQIKMKDFSGPHSALLIADRLYLDFYQEEFSLLAGIRRLTQRLNLVKIFS